MKIEREVVITECGDISGKLKDLNVSLRDYNDIPANADRRRINEHLQFLMQARAEFHKIFHPNVEPGEHIAMIMPTLINC